MLFVFITNITDIYQKYTWGVLLQMIWNILFKTNINPIGRNPYNRQLSLLFLKAAKYSFSCRSSLDSEFAYFIWGL